MCNIFRNVYLAGQVEASRVGGWCSVSMGGRTGACTLLFLIRWRHYFMGVSYFPHMSYY